jgi:hypothetical protein
MNMKYAIYFEVQGYKDTFNVKSAKERDMCLKELLRNDAEYKNICWCKIYVSGEYGKRVFVDKQKGNE